MPAAAQTEQTSAQEAGDMRDTLEFEVLVAEGVSRAADTYVFDRETGHILGCSLYGDKDKASRLPGAIYTVHTGSWGGLLTRILNCLAALIGATLPLTGYYLWIRRLRRGKSSPNTRQGKEKE